MQVVLEDAEGAEEHAPNFKGLIKGHRVLNRNRARRHLTLMADYFAHDALFDHFRRHFRMRKTVFNRLYHGARSYDDYFILKKASLVTRIARPHSGWLHMAWQLIRGMSTHGCLRAHAEMPWSVLQLPWSRCSDLST